LEEGLGWGEAFDGWVFELGEKRKVAESGVVQVENSDGPKRYSSLGRCEGTGLGVRSRERQRESRGEGDKRVCASEKIAKE
jgi:hypothetical protein